MNDVKPITSSVIICTRNRPQDMVVCLQSLAQQTQAPTELIVVDSSDVPLEQQEAFKTLFCGQHFPRTRLVYQHSKPGLTYQRNVGTRLAHADVLYFFDDDVKLTAEYLQKMNAIFAHSPEYGGGMGCVTNIPDKASLVDRAFRVAFLMQRTYASGYFTASGMPTHVYGTSQFKDIEVLGGCCMAYRAALVKEHLFDETLGRYSYMEDCDISFRASRRCKFFYNPDAKLEHFHSPASRDTLQDNSALFIRNYTYLFFKNFYPQNRVRIVAYVWTMAGLFLQTLLWRNMPVFKGYCIGLKRYYWKDKN